MLMQWLHQQFGTAYLAQYTLDSCYNEVLRAYSFLSFYQSFVATKQVNNKATNVEPITLWPQFQFCCNVIYQNRSALCVCIKTDALKSSINNTSEHTMQKRKKKHETQQSRDQLTVLFFGRSSTGQLQVRWQRHIAADFSGLCEMLARFLSSLAL